MQTPRVRPARRYWVTHTKSQHLGRFVIQHNRSLSSRPPVYPLPTSSTLRLPLSTPTTWTHQHLAGDNKDWGGGNSLLMLIIFTWIFLSAVNQSYGSSTQCFKHTTVCIADSNKTWQPHLSCLCFTTWRMEPHITSTTSVYVLRSLILYWSLLNINVVKFLQDGHWTHLFLSKQTAFNCSQKLLKN